MKYLKLFEDINNDFTKTDPSTFWASIKNAIPLNNEDISFLSKKGFSGQQTMMSTNMIKQDNDQYIIAVVKTDDDWYYVMKDYYSNNSQPIPQTELYKCDQFIGLKNCLTDINVMVKESYTMSEYGYELVNELPNIDDMTEYTDSEITKLSTFGVNTISSLVQHWSPLHPVKKSKLRYYKDNNTIMMLLCKTDDEWYYIESYMPFKAETRKFYKCDQWDGLLNCLKKEFNLGC